MPCIATFSDFFFFNFSFFRSYSWSPSCFEKQNDCLTALFWGEDIEGLPLHFPRYERFQGQVWVISCLSHGCNSHWPFFLNFPQLEKQGAVNLWQSGIAAAGQQQICPSSTVKAVELQLLPSRCSVAGDFVSGLWVILDWLVHPETFSCVHPWPPSCRGAGIPGLAGEVRTGGKTTAKYVWWGFSCYICTYWEGSRTA